MADELHILRAFSARIGADPLQVQAAGGNTSVKQGGIMWIKASGTWLADSLTQDNFVPLDLRRLSAALAASDPACESCVDFVRQNINPSGLRPSIETSVHCLMPQRVVAHVHCVDTIAWAIQANAEAEVNRLLAGLPYAFIPYARPGLDLSVAIAARLKSDTAILVLQNHGLVVAADSVEAADKLLVDVRAALKRPVRKATNLNYSQLAAVCREWDYMPAADDETHALAVDPLCLERSAGVVFYPDHAVFLGIGVATGFSVSSPLVAVPGLGVAISKTAVRAIEPMGRCLADVMRRVPADALLNPIPGEEIARLLNWDAEKYRQNLTQKS